MAVEPEKMEAYTVTLRDGAKAVLFRTASGAWACPVCGNVGLYRQPYFDDGSASYDMCSCGFEFGFDDDPGASADAVESVAENWARWRTKFLRKFKGHPEALAQVEAGLRAIGVAVPS